MGGFHALFGRALVLARAEVPWLAEVQLTADGCLEGLDKVTNRVTRDELVSAELAVVSHVIDLLVTFIGPALTLAIMKEIWPEAAFTDLNFREEDL